MKAFAALRAYPTLLRIGLAEAVAYRAEMFVWMLSTTMPLVNLALWHAIAASGPIGRYGQPELVAYFLSALIVRQFSSSWIMWEMNQELRSGTFSLRLLRPIHPLLAYSAENLAAMPLRSALAGPVAIFAFITVGGHYSHDPVIWLLTVLAIAGAWGITFAVNALFGTFAFFSEQSLALFDVYLAAFFGLSGYLFPLEFLSLHTPRATHLLHFLPFYYQNGFPVELMIGHHDRAAALAGVAATWGWAAAILGVALVMWRLGVRRWNAYGA